MAEIPRVLRLAILLSIVLTLCYKRRSIRSIFNRIINRNVIIEDDDDMVSGMYTRVGTIKLWNTEYYIMDNPYNNDSFYNALAYFMENKTNIQIRSDITNYIYKNGDKYIHNNWLTLEEQTQLNATDSWRSYIINKRDDIIPPSNIEIIAFEDVYNVCIRLVTFNLDSGSYKYHKRKQLPWCLLTLPFVSLGRIDNTTNHYVSMTNPKENIPIKTETFYILKRRQKFNIARNRKSGAFN